MKKLFGKGGVLDKFGRDFDHAIKDATGIQVSHVVNPDSSDHKEQMNLLKGKIDETLKQAEEAARQKEAARLEEAARQEAVKQEEEAKQELIRLGEIRLEADRQEAAKQEVLRLEEAKEETVAGPTAISTTGGTLIIGGAIANRISTLTVSNVKANDTVSIEGVTFTAVADGAPAGDFMFEIGLNDYETASNLARAIQACEIKTLQSFFVAVDCNAITFVPRIEEARQEAVRLEEAKPDDIEEDPEVVELNKYIKQEEEYLAQSVSHHTTAMEENNDSGLAGLNNIVD
jgi:hypothetical protein